MNVKNSPFLPIHSREAELSVSLRTSNNTEASDGDKHAPTRDAVQ